MTTEKSRTYGHVILTGLVDKEEDQFVSYCRELGTASCGDTIDEALENLGEAIEVHLKGLEETGELRSVLRERNIRINEGPPTSDGVYVGVTPGKIFTIYSCLVPLASAIQSHPTLLQLSDHESVGAEWDAIPAQPAAAAICRTIGTGKAGFSQLP